MSLIIGNENLRYGSLAQANTYYDLACVPTSFTNAFLALNIDALMQDPSRPGSWESLNKTRNSLAEDYFYTSDLWAKANMDAEYNIPPGTLPANALKGTLDYIAQRDLRDNITLAAAGYTKGELNRFKFNFTGFDVTANINGADITSPSQKDFRKIFQELKPGDSANIQDFLMQGLLRGPLVFGMFYLNGEGHAVTATQITIDDRNANGILEKNENSYIHFIDPLNPGNTYTPSIGEIASDTEFKKIQTTNGPHFTEAKIWQGKNGHLMLEYDQKSLTLSKDKIQLTEGDSSNTISTTTNTAFITMAASLSTSGLASDFDQQAGSLAAAAPGLIDFSSLVADPTSQNKSLNGYAYSNESSTLKNNFLYYECLNQSGTIAVTDPLTGTSSFIEPGDPEYASTAWSLAQSFSKSDGAMTLGTRESNDSESLTPFSISIQHLTTGYLAPITQSSSGELWSIFSEANRDSQQHYQSTGNMSWRMEDLYELGDKDFTDLHVSILIESMS